MGLQRWRKIGTSGLRERLGEVASFIEDYSAARGAPLSIDEVRAAHAVAGYLVAYTARCEHALGERGHFTQALAQSGRAYLAPSL